MGHKNRHKMSLAIARWPKTYSVRRTLGGPTLLPCFIAPQGKLPPIICQRILRFGQSRSLKARYTCDASKGKAVCQRIASCRSGSPSKE
eukprot:6088713-Amphidinium_carterae.1